MMCAHYTAKVHGKILCDTAGLFGSRAFAECSGRKESSSYDDDENRM